MFTIKFADGKNMFPRGIKGPVLEIFGRMASWAEREMLAEIVITAGDEPGHPGDTGKPSYHGEGLAVDVRVHQWDKDTRDSFFTFMRSLLGSFYDVVEESFGLPNEHFHIEYDRRRAEAAGVVA